MLCSVSNSLRVLLVCIIAFQWWFHHPQILQLYYAHKRAQLACIPASSNKDFSFTLVIKVWWPSRILSYLSTLSVLCSPVSNFEILVCPQALNNLNTVHCELKLRQDKILKFTSKFEILEYREKFQLVWKSLCHWATEPLSHSATFYVEKAWKILELNNTLSV